MKRVILMLLLVAVLCGLLPGAVLAHESGVTAAAVSASAYDTTDEVVTAIRAAMVQRQNPIRVRLTGRFLTSAEASELVWQALEHTGDPKEGDYIRTNMLGWSTSLETGYDADDIYSQITVECDFLTDAAMEAEVDAAVEELLTELDLWDGTNYEKVKGAYDWITENVDYDYWWDDLEDDTGEYEHSTHAALIRREAVCQGYASLYYRLLLELGVDCRYISGTATDITGTERHGWNIVYLDGRYYNCDPTWDRDLMGHYRYFLCTDANFPEHERDPEYKSAEFYDRYPMAIVPYVRKVTASGQIHANMAWVLDGDTGTLTVAGTGAIPNYRFSHAPWYDYRESVIKIVVSEGITEVGERAFYWCTNCTEVQLPQSLTAIREYGFNNLRSLQSITLPSNLRTIEFCGFSECVALKSITLPDSVTTVGSNAFSNCYMLTSAKLSAGMTTIPSSMFGGDYMLAEVELPEGITYIDDTAFINCGFSSFTLPASVTGLGTAVFSGCTYLQSFTVEEGNTAYKAVNGVLFTADGTHLVCYPCAKYGDYAVPEGTRYIDYGAFRSAKYLYEVEFPSTLVEIGGYAFSYCKRLLGITLNENIQVVGDDAFRSCTSLTKVTFENPDVDLVSYTFVDCTSLASITLPSNLTEIPNGLFDGCTSLKSITIPRSVTRIGSVAFSDCDSLREITIPGTVRSIGQQAFDFCNKLETIVFEEGVETLGWICIRNAPKLKKVVIPSSVTRIEQANSDSKNFDDCPDVVLYVNCGSYGYTYARSRGLAHQVSHVVSATVVPPGCTSEGYTNYRCPCGITDYDTDFVPATGHTYVGEVIEPTCTEDGYTHYNCVFCGDSYMDDFVPAAHAFCEWYTADEASCTAEGLRQRDCMVCGYGEAEPIPAWGHDYEAVVTDPTCTGQGYTTYTCHCGESYVDDYVDALGHDWDGGVVTVEPTEETKGEIRYTCRRCSETKTEIIPELEHEHRYEAVLTAPTCTEKGYTTHTCRCGDSYVDTYVDALGHDMGEWTVVTDATCTKDGSERRDCSRCDHYETRVLEATGHEYESTVTAPTCTEKGYTTYTCHCGNSYVSDYVDALGHDMGKWTVVTDATCTKDGSERRDCSRCDHYETRAVEATGHDYESTVTAPTCTEKGYTTYTCRCGDSYVSDYVEALGHDMGAWTVVTAATCTKDGSERRDCSRCDHYETRIIAATGHDYETRVTAPTCTEGGYTEYVCTACGDRYISDHVPATGHDHEAVVAAPTCTERGYTTYTCHCGDRYVSDYTDALGHELGDWTVDREPGCTEEGGEIRECTRCDYTESRAVDALGHDWDDGVVTVEPTEESVGEMRYTCKRCAETKTEIIPELVHEHRYEAVVTDPTCTERGYTTHTCRCGDSYVSDYTNPLGHSFTQYVSDGNATCTNDGTKTAVCDRCDATDTVTDPGSATGHDYESSVTAPACTEQGYTTYTCHCGDSYVSDYTDPLGHDWDDGIVTIEPTEETVGEMRYTCKRCAETKTEIIPELVHEHRYEAVVTDPTCTERGYTTHTCRCGDSYVSDYTNPLGHSFTQYVSDDNATCTNDGTKTAVCDRCDATDTVTDPGSATGHDYESNVNAPTCTEKGYTTYTCRCGDSYVSDYTDPLGHSFTDWVTVQEGLEERSCTRCGHTEQREAAKPENPFTDVPEGTFYHAPVLWAVENGITNGTSATTFGPNEQCMRAQVVTFLWRAAGSPEPSSDDNPFVDVKPTDFYYKAVLWAVEKGITNGLDATHFGPLAYCNRAQVVTFLWRAQGNPTPTGKDMPFTDVAAGAWYETPILWAVEHGITNGMSATEFGINTICNRAQIVTFLYRTYN